MPLTRITQEHILLKKKKQITVKKIMNLMSNTQKHRFFQKIIEEEKND